MEQNIQPRYDYYAMIGGILYALAYSIQGILPGIGFGVALGVLYVNMFVVAVAVMSVFISGVLTRGLSLMMMDYRKISFRPINFGFWMAQHIFSLITIHQLFLAGSVFLSGAMFSFWLVGFLIYTLVNLGWYIQSKRDISE